MTTSAEYERAAALITDTMLVMMIRRTFSHLSSKEREEIVVAVIDKMARRHNHGVRLEVCIGADDDG